MNSFTKEEWAAYTIRPKIHALLPTHLTPHTLPTLKNKKKITLPNYFLSPDFSVKKEVRKLNIDHLVCPTTLIGGESEAKKQLLAFISRIDSYDTDRNDPTKDGTSKLSAYLHFGMISPIDIILSICRAKKIHPAEITDHKSVSAYVEELVVRRDLAYNYCKFNPQHTTFEGLNDWSKITLNKHRKDKREYTYTLREFEEAKTHDPAWNAAQHEMVATGRMHGYMRMYWCKKILEWTKTPEDAFRIAVFLNDKYQLDGRDPNGYTGIAWSIGGKHDRPWFERAIFGQVRYMNFAGLKKKFNINAYISKNTTK